MLCEYCIVASTWVRPVKDSARHFNFPFLPGSTAHVNWSHAGRCLCHLLHVGGIAGCHANHRQHFIKQLKMKNQIYLKVASSNTKHWKTHRKLGFSECVLKNPFYLFCPFPQLCVVYSVVLLVKTIIWLLWSSYIYWEWSNTKHMYLYFMAMFLVFLITCEIHCGLFFSVVVNWSWLKCLWLCYYHEYNVYDVWFYHIIKSFKKSKKIVAMSMD